MKNFTVGYNTLLVLAPNGCIFTCDLSVFGNVGGLHNNGIIEAKHNDNFKNVENVFGGFANFFVYEKEVFVPIEDWGN